MTVGTSILVRRNVTSLRKHVRWQSAWERTRVHRTAWTDWQCEVRTRCMYDHAFVLTTTLSAHSSHRSLPIAVAATVVTVLVSLHFQIPYPQSHEFWTTFEDAVWDKLEKTDLSLSGHRVLDVCDWTNGCSTLRFCPDPRDLPEQQRDGDRLVSFCPFSVVSLLLLLLNKRDYFPSVHAN